MSKATEAADLLLSELKKAKKMPVGTVSHGRKKVAEGKWVPVGDDKNKGVEGKKRKISIMNKEQNVKTSPISLNIGFDHPFEIAEIEYPSGTKYPSPKKGFAIIESKTGMIMNHKEKRKDVISAVERDIKYKTESEFKKLISNFIKYKKK